LAAFGGALLLALAILMLWPQNISLPGVLAVFFSRFVNYYWDNLS
jgi:flagellar biosynthesis protein FliP